MYEGITIAGTVLTDSVKTVDSYPSEGMLANVRSAVMSVGGCVPNTLMDLAIMDPALKLSAVGRVGDDAAGKFVTKTLRGAGIDVSHIKVSETLGTSVTDVFGALDSGERTFFHNRGANAELSEADIAPEALECRLFHIGYLLLLDVLDLPDAVYGTRLAKLLAAVQARGIKTSIDVVSENSSRFASVVLPALKYCDYAVLNEIESGEAAGISARDASGKLNPSNIRRILERLMEAGVRQCAVIHCPEAGFSLQKDGAICGVASLDLPKGYIKGTVGAGDAFCAACLYALYHGYNAEDMLKLASCAAACNLSAFDSISGMRPLAQINALEKIYKRKSL